MRIVFEKLRTAGFNVEVSEEDVVIYPKKHSKIMTTLLKRVCNEGGLGDREWDDLVGTVHKLQVIKVLRDM